MAITTMDQLVAGIAGGQSIDTLESALNTNGAGTYESLWTAAGRPGSGVAPSTAAGVAPTSATAGAIPFTNPTGSNTLYLAQLELSCTIAGTVIFYDRLVHTATLSGTVTTAQTVSSAALTRHTSGANVGLWLEWYTATGSTAVTASVSYTNQSGTSGQIGTASITASPVAGRMIPVTLASGDSGVQSVQSVTLSATTGTAGNFGITLAYRHAQIPIVTANYGSVFDWGALGLPAIASSACLAYMVLASNTNTGTILSGLTLAQG